MIKIYDKTKIFARTLFIPIEGASPIQNIIIWTGLGSDNNWSTSSNWNINVPQAYDILQFAGTTRLAPFNNLTVDTPYNGITFNAGAGAFALSGNRFILNSGSITNNSSNTQTINNNIVLGSSAGTINCNASNINLNGNISGSGSLTKLGTSTLQLSGNNSYTGNTYISAGLVNILNSNPFGTGAVNLSTVGRIQVPSTSPQAFTVINNPINVMDVLLGSSITSGRNTQYNRLITSSNTGAAQSVSRISVSNNATATYTGGLSSRRALTLINVFDGTGTHIISSVPISYGTHVFQPQGGRACNTILAVSGNTMNIFKTNSNVFLTVPFAINNFGSCIFGYSNNHALIALSGDQVFTNMGLQAGTSFAESSGNNIFNNTSTFVNLTANATTGSTVNTYVGSISGNINFIKTGTGSLTLSGGAGLNIGPRYTGFTAISAGTLINYALSSNPSNKVNFAQFTNTALTVNFTTPPIVGDSFILLPARTVNLYPSVTLQNASGRTASYNSTTSTLSVIT